MTPSPLDGIRVLDLSRVLSGPYAGRILSDLGAEVVKVEPPTGDLIRMYGEVRAGRSGFYLQQNAGKQNVCIDLDAPGAVELVRSLAAKADVVIENFRPGVADRLGIGWSDLSMVNPALVMLSISGYGQDEPAPPRGAFAAVIHATSGLVMRQAERDGAAPTDPMLSVADFVAGLHGVIAVLAALRLRSETGTGQWIDMAMQDAMLATDEYAHHHLDGSPLARLGGTVWEAEDGPVMIAADQRHTWVRLAAVHGLTDGCDDSASFEQKVQARRTAIAAWVRERTRAQVHIALAEADVLSADAITADEAYRSPDAVRRQMVSSVDAGDGTPRDVIEMPYRFSAATAQVRGPAPARGEHNDSVLERWLGYDTAGLSDLEQRGVLVAEAPASS